MGQPSQVLMRLNAETRARHASSDATWLGVVAPAAGLRDYAAALIKTYGFEAPLESALAYTPGLPEVIDLRRRTRAGLIAQDLIAIGFKPSDVAALLQCDGITPFAGAAQALGWMYVVERAALLHDSIRRRLLARSPEVARAASFLAAAGGAAGSRWLAFGQVLDRVARTPEIAEQIVTAAHAAFDCQEHWLDRGAAVRSAGS